MQNLFLLTILTAKRMLLYVYIKSHPLPFLIGHQLRKWRVQHEALITPDMQTYRNRYRSGSGAIMNKLWPATVIMDWKWLKIEHAEPERWRCFGILPMKKGRHFGATNHLPIYLPLSGQWPPESYPFLAHSHCLWICFRPKRRPKIQQCHPK